MRGRIGDIFEVSLLIGYAYLRYAGKDESGIHVIEVLATDGRQLKNLSSAAKLPVRYAFGSHIAVLKKHPAFRYLGRVDCVRGLPKFRKRMPGGWELPNGHFVTELNDMDAKLPILEGEPAESILKRLNTDWLPESDREDLLTYIRTAASNVGKNVTVRTFITFASERKATEALEALIARGHHAAIEDMRVEVRLEVPREALSSSEWLNEREETVVAVCEKFGGRYQGNEIG